MFRTLITAVLLATAWVRMASAFELVPIVQDFAPAGAEATQTFGILNPAPEGVAVQITMVKRNVGVDGAETLVPAEEDFLVYPPQAIIGAGKVQLVQVRWMGTRTPTEELAYRIIVEQLPINMDERQAAGAGARLTILLRYEGAVYVVPAGVQPDIRLEGVARVNTPEGPKLAVTVENRGKSHGILTTAELAVRGPGADGRTATVNLPVDALETMIGANVQAGHRREFLLDWPTTLAAGDLTGTLKAQVER